MSDDFTVKPLGFPWETADPFLFCVHHDDAYPAGDEHLGPVADLDGRDLGQDFSRKDGWSMYHGEVVPGFPGHPHRGFETVTIVRQGLIDHFDSLGATARFGGGDVQWLTAGAGISHSEMFPLVESERANPAELFQIWLNLPRAQKMAKPHFAMLWNERIPRREQVDANGNKSVVTYVAGDPASPPPPPESWAAQPDSHVAIWTIALEPGATLTLPAGHASARRTLYFFAGSTITASGRSVKVKQLLAWKHSPTIELVNTGDTTAELLMLQGKPIAEPTVQYGPFVMNSADEIRQAFADYQRTQFGGWPWPSPDPVHARDRGRFAQHADGRIEEAPTRQ